MSWLSTKQQGKKVSFEGEIIFDFIDEAGEFVQYLEDKTNDCRKNIKVSK